MFAAHNGKPQQQNWRYPYRNRTKQPARHAERPLQLRLADTKTISATNSSVRLAP